MLLLSSLLSSSCFPIPFPPLLLSYPTGCGTILLDIFQRVQLMWLAAAASGVRAVAQHHARSRSPSLVLRWPGGRLLCLRLLPPRVHRREQVRPRALEPHCPRTQLPVPERRQPACVYLCVCVLLPVTGAAGALKKCQNQEWPKNEVSELPLSREHLYTAPVSSVCCGGTSSDRCRFTVSVRGPVLLFVI